MTADARCLKERHKTPTRKLILKNDFVVYVASECILFFMYSIFNFVSVLRQQSYCFEYCCSLLQNVHIILLLCLAVFFNNCINSNYSFCVNFSVNRASCVKHTYGNVHTHGNICQILRMMLN